MLTEPNDEVEIVWLESSAKYHYLREWNIMHTRPNQKPGVRKSEVKLVAYARVKKNRSGPYDRRYWCLKRHDWDMDPNGGYNPDDPDFRGFPAEAVRPDSIAVSKESDRDLSHLLPERFKKSKPR